MRLLRRLSWDYQITAFRLRTELLALRKRLVDGASGGLTMADFDIVLASVSALLNRPHCRQCGNPMLLISVASVGPHESKRRFECPMCDRAKQRDHPDPLGRTGSGTQAQAGLTALWSLYQDRGRRFDHEFPGDRRSAFAWLDDRGRQPMGLPYAASSGKLWRSTFSIAITA